MKTQIDSYKDQIANVQSSHASQERSLKEKDAKIAHLIEEIKQKQAENDQLALDNLKMKDRPSSATNDSIFLIGIFMEFFSVGRKLFCSSHGFYIERKNSKT